MGAKLEITQEKLDQLEAVMNANMQKPGPLMPTLHEAQKIFGCVPIPIQKIISRKLGVSVAEINGVVTFYAQFSIEPKGKHIVGVCLGTACYVRGSQEVLDAISSELKIKAGETIAKPINPIKNYHTFEFMEKDDNGNFIHATKKK